MNGPPVDTAATIRVDAYTGDGPVTGSFADGYGAWAVNRPRYGEPTMKPQPPNPADWSHGDVGWGVILSEKPGLTAHALATADDAPEPIRALVEARHGKVLRYRAAAALGDWVLRDYAGGGDLFAPASPAGARMKALPMYLLIYGSPAEIPWQVQFMLNPVRHVGRLDLEGAALENYVTALMNDWSSAQTRYSSPVVWAVDHGATDITRLMRDTVAQPIFAALENDDDMSGATFVDGLASPATTAALAGALAANRPSLIITSSHGMTGPLSDVDAMRATLGLPVDQHHDLVDAAALTSRGWTPDGAVWFAQACCSAGAQSPTAYAGLFDPGGELDHVLTGITACGAMTAPLARELLGHAQPLRAFVGHVEPTFDWTLSFPPNRQALTADLVRVLYTEVCLGQPIGLALSGLYPAIGSLLTQYVAASGKYETAKRAAAKPFLDMLVYSRVTAHDRASTVILGDPTAAIPVADDG